MAREYGFGDLVMTKELQDGKPLTMMVYNMVDGAEEPSIVCISKTGDLSIQTVASVFLLAQGKLLQ